MWVRYADDQVYLWYQVFLCAEEMSREGVDYMKEINKAVLMEVS